MILDVIMIKIGEDNMNTFVCLFLPSVIGIKFMDTLIKNIKIKDLIMFYFTNVLLSNYIVIFLMKLFWNFSIGVEAQIISSTTFAIKYITLSLVVNLFIAFIGSLVIKNFDISLEAVHGKKRK